MTTDQEPPALDDDDTVEWIYANDLGAIAFDGATVRIEFDLVSPARPRSKGGDDKTRRRPVTKLALTPAATQQLIVKLGELKSAIAAKRARPRPQTLN